MAVLGTTDISTTLVRNTLGENSNDVGSLCRSDKVNRWSKFKPIYHTSPFGLTDTDYLNAQYGIIINEMVAMNSSGEWNYSSPTLSSPKRLGDFRKYYHDAPTAFMQVVGNSIHVSPFFGQSYGVGFEIPQAPSGMENYCLTVANIAPNGGGGPLLDNYYLGAALYNSSGNLVAEYYSLKKIKYSSGVGADMDGASISLMGALDSPSILSVPRGSYLLYLFITDMKPIYQEGSPPQYGKYWPINWTSLYPKNIPITVYGLEDVYTITVIGIRPTGGVWSNGDEDWKTGLISQLAVGNLSNFEYRIRLNNIAGRYTFIPYNKINLFYDKLTDWDGTTSQEIKGFTSESTITLASGEYIDLTFTNLPVAPTFTPSGSVDIIHYPNFEVYYGVGEDKEAFPLSIAPQIGLQYVL